MTHGAAPRHRVAIVGGGYAGLAAALTLARGGLAVTVFEQARTLGGRARRVERDGLVLDNGQHLAIGAYAELQRLVAGVHPPGGSGAPFARLPLTLAPFPADRQTGATGPTDRTGPIAAPESAVALHAWPLPAPLHLGIGLLAARGLRWRDKLALGADMRRLARTQYRRPAAETVAECFASTPAAARAALWDPLCLAALNTPPEQASAQMFATVLALSLGAGARASDFLIPRRDLSALFPDPAAAAIVAAGGSVRVGVGVRGLAPGSPEIPGRVLLAQGDEGPFAAMLVAVGPHQLAALRLEREPGSGEATAGHAAAQAAWGALQAQVARFTYESITTVYLGFPAPRPFAVPIQRLDDRPGQWVFDRRDALTGSPDPGRRALLAVVISGSGPHDAIGHSELAAQVEAQLRRLDPALPSATWSRVIAEKRATYACVPGLVRPRAGRLAPGLYLAGDYTDPELPPTLEAAVRSGVTAAREIAVDLAHGT